MPDAINTETARAANPTLVVTGDPDAWVLIAKASLAGPNGWMKSTKAMQSVSGVIVQVSTEHRDGSGSVSACAEALAFIPGSTIDRGDGKPGSARIVTS